jgi:HlyD family secretion protein
LERPGNPDPPGAGEPRAEPPRTRRDLSALRMDRDTPEPRRRGPRWPWIALALLILAVLAVVVGPRLPWFGPSVETAVAQRITPAEASTVLTATGYTYARSKAAVGAKIVGRVEELPVDEGDPVRAGQVVAVLDSRDLKAALKESEARLAEAHARLEDARREQRREEKIFQAGASTEELYDAANTQLDIAAAQVKTAEAELAGARARLEYAVIRSPIDGVVIERTVEVGEMVAPGGFTSQQSSGAILRIADPTSLEVEADINESYISRVRKGQPALIRVDAVPDHDYHGELRQIVPTADRQKAVVEVKVTLDDRDERLVPDMSCTVTFLEGGSDSERREARAVVLVAADAVLRSGTAPFVFRVEDGRVRKVPVELGEQRGEKVVVLSGLDGGETVVRGDLARLRDGQRVRIRGR